jgi:hypothetical protein
VKLLSAIVFFILMLTAPFAAHAISVIIDPTPSQPNSGDETPLSSAGTTSVPIAGPYGNFTISNNGSLIAVVQATDGSSSDTLKLTNAVITYNGTGPGDLQIVFTQSFSGLAVNPQTYGVFLQGFFSRGTSLASGDTISFAGFVAPPCTFDGEIQICSTPDQIASTLLWDVTTQGNKITPSGTPLKGTQSISCTGCLETLSSVLTIHFAQQGDKITLPGSAGVLECDTQNICDQLIAQESVPEPAPWVLLVSGLGGLVLIRRKTSLLTSSS